MSQSLAFKNVIEIASKVAAHNIPVLIEGELGSGKEWLARSIHFASPRANGEFVVVDCADGVDPFLECELFGYVRGSFTGALHEKKGLLEAACGGTLFLDHVSKISLSFQGKLLRLMNEGIFYKIGGVSEEKADVRVIAATAQDLKSLVSKGKFREDLYYQLSVMRLTIPPLRERREDVLLLADFFLDAIAKREGAQKKELTQEARAALLSYHWPANISELEKEIERSVVLAGTATKISPRFFSPHILHRRRSVDNLPSGSIASGSLKEQKRAMIMELEKNAIRGALRKTAGNRTHAAELLSISRQELLRKISAYRIK